jgi:CubicO group peptidase (beta-lactamase class C family)
MLIATISLTTFAATPPQPELWQPLTALLARWRYTENFLVQVGNASGLVYEFSKGNMTSGTHVGTASTSKWPSAMALLGVVADGSIDSLDSPVNKYVPWWTRNTSDPRSHVTFRHLLSFTSGFGNGMPGNESYKGLDCMRWQDNITYDACAKQVHDKVEQWCWPGYCYSYNANHLKLAGVVAMHATGLTIQQVITKYLNVGLRMPHTHCSYTPNGSHVPVPEPNPDLSVCLNTTGGDYAAFLDGVLNHKVLTPALIAESEKDATPGAMMGEGYTLYGHYGFGHFLECFDSYRGYTLECKRAQVHCDPGAFGYYPLMDRRYGYWMQITAYEHGASYPRSGIPEACRYGSRTPE